jgi:serine/threonine protein phosphatase PrpC
MTPTLSNVINRSNTIFGYTEPGAGKKKFECQDTYSIIDLPEDHLKFYGVFDGHGNVGRQVSTYDCYVA